ncbi:MAG: hypothetical protein JO286_05970 [Solirubrobacterales bacterium]|nr:hypothetical protein [Solirubrobacterales bacterium]
MRAAVALTISAFAAGGCGASHEHERPATRQSPLAQAQATHEYPSPSPPPQTAAAAAHAPIEAIRAFATAYINWDAQTVAADMRSLAAAAVGQARAAMILAAAETAGDYELQRGGIANRGTVEAIAPRPSRPREFIVVTLESTTATNTTAYQGLRPAWHVALATVAEQSPGQWVLSGWQPEN